MISLQEVAAQDIVTTVSAAIGSARHTILSTMLIAEELRHPLPEAYFLQLEEKISQGVQLARLAFGTTEELQRLPARLLKTSVAVELYQTEFYPYQRLILIDHTTLFFAKQDETQRHFYTTTKASIIRPFKDYFALGLQHAQRIGTLES